MEVPMVVLYSRSSSQQGGSKQTINQRGAVLEGDDAFCEALDISMRKV